MKCRSVLYGYKCVGGNIEFNDDEKIVVLNIFHRYSTGESLLKIAECLNEQRVEYKPGVCGWNKARLARIIDDERYTGKNGYPRIIDETVYENSRKLKERKNVQKNVDKTAGVFQIRIPIRCAECGGQMIRRVDCRRKRKTKWRCNNPACKKETFISDDETLARLTKIINGMISNPDTIGDKQEKEKISIKDFNCADRDAVVKNISKLYSVIDEKTAMSERVKDILKNMSSLTEFSADVLFDIADEVQINENGTVSIKLINGQIVGG